MITALLIVQNQEHLLKQHLQTLFQHTHKTNGNIILIDNNSSDNTQEYVTTHFTNINYMKNNLEEKISEIFNKCLPFINTPYILLCDPHLNYMELNIKNLVDHCIEKNLYLLTLPISTFQTKLDRYNGLTLLYQKASLKRQKTSSPQKTDCIISDAMILRTKDLILQNGLNTHYKSFTFSLFNFSINSLKKGLAQDFEEDAIIRNESPKNSLPYNETQKDYLHDNVLFQYIQFHSNLFKTCRLITNILNCLTFKPKTCFTTIEAWINYSFRFKKKKMNWHILKDTDILIQKKTKKHSL